MKKIIRLTESDLTRIVRRVIREQGPFAPGMGPSTKSTTPPGVNPTYKPNLKTTKTKNEKWWDSMAELLKSEGFENNVQDHDEGYIEHYKKNFENGVELLVSFSNANIGGPYVGGYQKKDEVQLSSLDLVAPCEKYGDSKYKPDPKCITKFKSFMQTLGPGCYSKFNFPTGIEGIIPGLGSTGEGFALKVWCKDSLKKVINYLKNLPIEYTYFHE